MQIIQTRHDTSAHWIALNPILLKHETGYEDDTGKFKVGDGITPWTGLTYSIPTGTAPPVGGTGGVTEEELEVHINADLPHPVYDNGSSLDLLYQNAKV